MVGEAKRKPLELPLPGEMVTQRHYWLSGGISEMDSKSPPHLHFVLPLGLCRRQMALGDDGRLP